LLIFSPASCVAMKLTAAVFDRNPANCRAAWIRGHANMITPQIPWR
jgi:hypothetical protein